MSFNFEQYGKLKNELPAEVTIVAVSKTKPISDIQEAYNLAVLDFGENYVQELLDKHEALPKDIRWHFIGHLQTNKVKYIAPFVHLIHGVDSEKLLAEIDKQGRKLNRKINCLLQIHIAKEETKFGMDANELNSILQKLPIYPFANVCGLMGMASFTEDKQIIESEFTHLHTIFKSACANFTTLYPNTFKPETAILSMGMSADYPIAIACGSNMIRVGSMLFGNRSNIS